MLATSRLYYSGALSRTSGIRTERWNLQGAAALSAVLLRALAVGINQADLGRAPDRWSEACSAMAIPHLAMAIESSDGTHRRQKQVCHNCSYRRCKHRRRRPPPAPQQLLASHVSRLLINAGNPTHGWCASQPLVSTWVAHIPHASAPVPVSDSSCGCRSYPPRRHTRRRQRRRGKRPRCVPGWRTFIVAIPMTARHANRTGLRADPGRDAAPKHGACELETRLQVRLPPCSSLCLGCAPLSVISFSLRTSRYDCTHGTRECCHHTRHSHGMRTHAGGVWMAHSTQS